MILRFYHVGVVKLISVEIKRKNEKKIDFTQYVARFAVNCVWLAYGMEKIKSREERMGKIK